MAAVKQSTLPAVLKEYDPSYEPRINTPGRTSTLSDSKRGSRATDRKKDDGKDSKTPRERTKPSGVSRERTRDLMRKQEIEKFERTYDNWQQIKQESRDEARRHYRSKITLQRDLIQAQDRLYQLKILKAEEDKRKKREEEKRSRQEQVKALMQICRQSLVDDKRNAGEEKTETEENSERVLTAERILSAERVLTPTRPVYHRMNSFVSPETSPTKQILRMPTTITESSEIAPPQSAGSEALQEEEEKEDDEEVPIQHDDDLPWHHEQLYKLYGEEANRFLYPKVEPRTTKPVNTGFVEKHQGVGGADALWVALREDSNLKLLNADESIPQDLKVSRKRGHAAYSAFVRECLARKAKPVKRNFYAKEDVPEMQRLMDHSRVVETQNFRHKMELMFRSSRINEDRTQVLLFNNPQPGFLNHQGQEGVERYLPSWIEGSDTDSEPSYKKWLPSVRHSLPMLPATSPAISNHDGDISDQERQESARSQDAPHLDSEWDFVLAKKAKPVKQNKSKYLFLTEEDATCPGEFSQRRKEMLEAKTIPQAYTAAGPAVKSQSAMALYSDSRSTRDSLNSSQNSLLRSQSVNNHRYNQRFWEPLSMTALEEYKTNCETVGSGEFLQGRTKMWPVASM